MSKAAQASILAVGLSVMAVALAHGGETRTVENPMYKHWAQFKPGTFVVVEQTSEMGGDKSTMTMTLTLKEVTPEKVVVETKTEMDMAGEKVEMPAQTQEHPATYAVEAPVVEEEEVEMPDCKTEEGEEELTVGGAKVKTKWIRTEMKTGDMTMISKSWTSDAVPGQIVRSETETTGDYPTKSVYKVVKFEIKK